MSYTYGKNLFHHFPEIICIDTVNQTHKDKRPLLTKSGIDTHGKMLIILHAFLPNKRACVFCWLYQPYFLFMFYLK